MSASSSPESFDYVIIGGGTAGLVLASRLSENPNNQVVVLEAGEDLGADPRVNIPAMWVQLAGTQADWKFKTTPQAGLGGREMGMPQGHLLGGSSALNSMNFVVSAESNIDMWKRLGNPGWDWASLSSSLDKVYRLHGAGEDSGAPKGNGTIQVTVPEEDSSWPQVWRETFAKLGFPTESNPLSNRVLGPVAYPDSVDPVSAARSYVCSAYLEPAKSRPNLAIWTSVEVEKILFNTEGPGEPTAVGVQYTTTKEGRVTSGKKVTARQEVILSAGVFNSPRILESSGVGDPGLLDSVGVPVVVDNPYVGENLQNHPVVPLSFEAIVQEGLQTIDGLNRQDAAAIGAAMELYGQQRGPFSRSNGNVMAHLPFPNITMDDGRRDLESILENTLQDSEKGATKTAPAYDQALKSYVRSVLESTDEASAFYITVSGWASYTPDGSWGPIPAGNESYFSIPVLLAHPLSRGSAHITKDTPTGLAINPNYLAHPLDIEILARHVQFAESVLATTAPLADCLNQATNAKRSTALPPGPRAFAGKEGLEAAKRYVRENLVGSFHYVGTCSMMPREMGGVVDPTLRVYGCRGLRVCDASVIPLATRANTMATVYSVAEKAAEIIMSGI